MAPRNSSSSSSALAPTDPAPLATLDELADLDMPEDADDGLGEASGEDFRITAKLLNMKGKGTDGRKIPEDEFYDTIDQTTTRELDAVFLYLHKTNLFSEFSNDTGTEIRCRSFDRVTGTMADGTERPCKGCPDDQWYTDTNGKRRKNCGPVYNVACLDRATRMPFWYRFKRTALPVFKQHLQRHHLLRRVVGTKRLNYPLYAFNVKLTPKLSDDGKYSLPLITKVGALSQAEFLECVSMCATIKANAAPLLAVGEQAAAADSGGGDASFDHGYNQAGGGGVGGSDPDAGKDFKE